jgi:hypothetical protein
VPRGVGNGMPSGPFFLVFYLASNNRHLIGLGVVSNFDVLQAAGLVVLVAAASQGCIWM